MSDDASEFVREGEYEPSGRNTVAFGLALLLIGFAAGAIAAALMTPKTGKQMRRTLKRKLDDARDARGEWSEQAETKNLTGDDRKKFMSQCLSAAGVSETQKEKMKSCNKEASAKGLKGDDRKTFMSTCLSGSTKQ